MLSKALVARLIPIDAVSDDMAVLMQIKDDEVEYLISLLAQSHQIIPIISVMMDLGRSPHNLFALTSRNVTVKLSEAMESFSENDQAKSAQLIWKMMELDYDENDNMSTISSNGTLGEEPEGMASLCAFNLCYLVDFLYSF